MQNRLCVFLLTGKLLNCNKIIIIILYVYHCLMVLLPRILDAAGVEGQPRSNNTAYENKIMSPDYINTRTRAVQQISGTLDAEQYDNQ